MREGKNVIILADDDQDDLSIINEIFSLHAHDLTIISVQNGEETLQAIERLQQQQITPCLIILDVNMPKLNGRQTLLRIKQNDQLSNVPLVLFSTSSDPRDKEFAKRNGASYVVKPFSYENLKSVVQWFIDQCAVH
ncbi:MAG TPA: response regulator [Chitinophagaceae bacterium]